MEYQDDMAPGLDSAPARMTDAEYRSFERALEHYDLDLVTQKLRPGVTVCVAAHPARLSNGMLTRALNSILAQTHQPDAILVVNDRDRHGAGWTRRQLLGAVETEWTAWIDSDDEWMPQHLERLLSVTTEPDTVFVYSWFHGNDPLGHFGLSFDPCRPHHTTMNVLVRTDIAKRVGFYDTQPPPFSNEDWGFITGVAAICCAEGLKMTHLPERTWHYHQQGQNTSGQPTQGDAR